MVTVGNIQVIGDRLQNVKRYPALLRSDWASDKDAAGPRLAQRGGYNITAPMELRFVGTPLRLADVSANQDPGSQSCGRT